MTDPPVSPPRRSNPLRRGAQAVGGRVAAPAQTGAGFLLGLLLWGWIILPFVEGGPVQVKRVLRAKFLNQAADRGWLP